MLTEYKMLVPLERNSDGLYHVPSLWDALTTRLLKEFGGYTRGEDVVGHWMDNHGNDIRDVSRVYYFATEHAEHVRTLAKWVSLVFDQQCVYLVTMGEAELVS